MTQIMFFFISVVTMNYPVITMSSTNYLTPSPSLTTFIVFTVLSSTETPFSGQYACMIYF